MTHLGHSVQVAYLSPMIQKIKARGYCARHDLLGALLIALAACSGSTPAAPAPPPTTTVPPQPDAMSLVGITPAQGTVLILDDPVSFSATVSYSLNSAASGRITLAVQDEAGRVLQGGAPPSVSIQRGSATATVAGGVNLPARGITRVDVVLSLLPEGATTATARVTVSYSVR
jgi:hypothetical protein